MSSCAQDAPDPATEPTAEVSEEGTGTAEAGGQDEEGQTEDHGDDDDHGHGHDHDHGHGHDHDPGGSADDARPSAEVAGASPRLGLTYDGGVLVVDAMTLEVLGDFPAEGFVRLNPAGDDRHLLLTGGPGFRLLDTGAWSVPHGDHDHSYTTEPLLTDLAFQAERPGHVVTHADQTVLFDDGTGQITVLDPDELTIDALPATVEHSTPEPHHGVALILEDGSLLHTLGDEDARVGAAIVDADGQELARSEQCPGVHGEAVAGGDAVVLGCEDGVLVLHGDHFHKVSTGQEYSRIGNLAGHQDFPVVLGDYKTDPDADLERPTTVSLIDVEAEELTLVELPASYSFRSLGIGPDGQALVLGTDGALHVIDTEQGEILDSIAVVAPWEEPTDWQEPRPTLHVLGNFGYVTEPATSQLHVVDLRSGEVIDDAELPQVPNEITGVSG
ncbi:zinc metallochaperone AztD [Ornithinimicrobium pratense]|uniref:PQQ-binding-like beta-propeller repeat protein n=1 Tax=Ornithinimicrobium pratense TaxID=2593973 RepID=A0A5J6V3L0_9MICO|nr:zinc metallochaperone AztD [Ornithinimicrobium pratense]QFG67894.1 hypothetical protein FY030_03385 [Ornithinimicrobium pratense]